MFQRRLSLRSLLLLPFLALWFLSGCYSRYLFPISAEAVSNIQDPASYAATNSPLIFRNYLTCSFSEQFGSAFMVDNSFYVSKFVNQRYNKISPYNAKKLYVTYLKRKNNTPKMPAHLLSVNLANQILNFPNNMLLGTSYEYIPNGGHNGFLAGFDRMAGGGSFTFYYGNIISEVIDKYSWNNFYLGYKRYFFSDKARPMMPFAGANIGNVYTYYSLTDIETTYGVKINTDDYQINKRHLLYLSGQAGLQYTAWRRVTTQVGVMAGGGGRFSTLIENEGAGETVRKATDISLLWQMYASVGIRL